MTILTVQNSIDSEVSPSCHPRPLCNRWQNQSSASRHSEIEYQNWVPTRSRSRSLLLDKRNNAADP